jgi:hypothetical protein
MYIAIIHCAGSCKDTTVASCDSFDSALHSLYNHYVRDFYMGADVMDAADELLLVEEPEFRSEARTTKGFSLPSWNADGTRFYRVREVT